MATKNLIDGNATNKRPLIFDDKTGEYKDGPRMDLADALTFVHDVYAKMTAADSPKVNRFEIQFALQGICQHTGWLPYEIAAAEQYATLFSGVDVAASAG